MQRTGGFRGDKKIRCCPYARLRSRAAFDLDQGAAVADCRSIADRLWLGGNPAMPLILTLTMNPALDIATTTGIVVPTEKLRCGEPRYDPGGGGINVARAVHLLGGEARAIFPAGGMSGAMLC